MLQILMHFMCLQEHITNRDLVKAIDAQKQKAEEEQRKLYVSAKQKMINLRKEKEKESFRYDAAKQPALGSTTHSLHV